MGMASLWDGQGCPGANSRCRLAEAGMMLRFFKPLVSADALGFLLIVGALQTLTYGISSSVRGADSNYLFIVCLVGMLLAFGMSRSRFSGTEASAAIGAVGVLG